MSVADKREAQRAKLVEVAAEAIRAGGAPSLKVRDLAAAAGCSTGQVYTFFEDVDAVVVAVNSGTISDLHSDLSRRVGRLGRDDPERALVALALAYLDFAVARPREWAALFERAAMSGKAAPDWHRAEHLHLVALVSRPLSRLLPDRDGGAVDELALTLFSMVHGIVSIGLQETVVSVPRDRLARQLETVVVATCRGLAGGAP